MSSDTFNKKQDPMKCFICGSQSEFISKPGFSLRESLCPSCGTSRRQSDIARIIIDTFLPGCSEPLRKASRKLSHFSIYEACSFGPVHDALCDLPNYVCSEFFDSISTGEKNPAGILCQDMQNLTFSSDVFDLVITQDVFEHIQQPVQAFYEIFRVLKPGGFHIFTIPLHEGRKTLKRIEVLGDEEFHRLPPVYHGDPLREKGALVYTDFGSDIDNMLDRIGFTTECMPCGVWYSSSEIHYIDNEKEYMEYIRYIKERSLIEYFKYNSWVFRSKKE